MKQIDEKQKRKKSRRKRHGARSDRAATSLANTPTDSLIEQEVASNGFQSLQNDRSDNVSEDTSPVLRGSSTQGNIHFQVENGLSEAHDLRVKEEEESAVPLQMPVSRVPARKTGYSRYTTKKPDNGKVKPMLSRQQAKSVTFAKKKQVASYTFAWEKASSRQSETSRISTNVVQKKVNVADLEDKKK